jgi:DNA-directed RNA polymerase specialized sigma24 family protein
MPAVPAKLFDVRNGNGCVDSDGTAYPRATLIVFKNNAAKDGVIEAFASAYSYQATIDGKPNPQSVQAFFHQKIQQHIRDIYRAAKTSAAAATAIATAAANAEAELPEA